MSGLVKDGELRTWFRTTDVKANACEVIHKVELPAEDAGDISHMDLSSGSLEEMFNIQLGNVTCRSLFVHSCVVFCLWEINSRSSLVLEHSSIH